MQAAAAIVDRSVRRPWRVRVLHSTNDMGGARTYKQPQENVFLEHLWSRVVALSASNQRGEVIRVSVILL